MLTSRASERIELRPAGVLRPAPFGIQPSHSLQPLEGGQQRAGIDLEDSARHLFNAAGNATYDFTSQLFFDEASNDRVMALSLTGFVARARDPATLE